MPLCPQITNTPITVTLTADFTVTNVVPVLAANTEQLSVVNSNAAAAQATATTALANAATAYNAAIGSLQPSASTIVNASNQITAIASNGITVYSGASATSGARVVMNSVGLAGYDASNNATFSITASTGAAVFSGSVTGATITGGTLNIGGNAIINSSGYLTATGATITGNITATSGSFTGSIYASSGTIGGFTIAANYIYSGSSLGIYADGTITGGNSATLFYGYVNIGGGSAGSERLTVAGASVMNGTILSTSSITTQTSFYTPYHATTGSSANGYVNPSSGLIARSTASSARYKENITNLWDVEELNPKKLLDIPVRAFSYKLDYLKNDDRTGILIPGLIAEEVDAIYPLATDYDNGHAENINDRAILIGLLALVQDLSARVEHLEGA